MGFVNNYACNLLSVALRRQPIRPLLFSYYVTHRCDLNCAYCSDGDGRRFKDDPVPELSLPDVKRLLAILRSAADTLDITGGEPMVREDLEEILAYARRIGFRTVLNTKGIGLEDRPKLLRFTDVIVLSVDSLDPGTLAQLIGRDRATAEGILSSLEFAISNRAETGTKVVISAVATPDNLKEVARVFRLAMEQRLGFQLSPEILGTQPNPGLRGNACYERLMDDVLAAKRSERGILGIRPYLVGIRDFNNFPCHPLLMPVIRPDGRMYYPCLESKQAEVSLLSAGSYWKALKWARESAGDIPKCGNCCHIFCHMALSLLQRHPLLALRELRHWRN